MTRTRSRWAVRALLGCAASLTLLVSAHAQDASRARLLTLPDATALSDHFPVVALARGVSGRVVLACTVAADGSSECSAAEETPAEMGFGAAAVVLAQDWRFSPRMENGAAIASTSRIPIEFQNPSGEAIVIEGTLTVDGVSGVAPAVLATDESRWNAEALDIAVCRWASRRDCRLPSNMRDFYKNAAYYPPAAHAAEAQGRALIACAVRSDRRVECAVEGETMPEMGFGESALRLVAGVLSSKGDQFESGMLLRVPVEFTLNPRGGHNDRSNWSETPVANDFTRYYPERAIQNNVQGMAELVCTIRDDRRISCGVSLERPTDYGFGQAALRLSAAFRLRADVLGQPGLAVGDRIRIPITFRLAG